MKKDARITIRCTSDMKEDLEKAARQRARTPNWLACNILENWLKARAKRRRAK